jgi:hypothetical protein
MFSSEHGKARVLGRSAQVRPDPGLQVLAASMVTDTPHAHITPSQSQPESPQFGVSVKEKGHEMLGPTGQVASQRKGGGVS